MLYFGGSPCQQVRICGTSDGEPVGNEIVDVAIIAQKLHHPLSGLWILGMEPMRKSVIPEFAELNVMRVASVHCLFLEYEAIPASLLQGPSRSQARWSTPKDQTLSI